MGYTLKTNLADKSNYGSLRKTNAIKYIVIHYTANDGDTDESNAKFFKNKNIKASAHYFVDDDSATVSVPENYVAWSVGGKRYTDYKSTGGAKLYNICTNNNSISIEMCDTIKDGKLMASEKTMQNTAELVKVLMARYNIPIDKVVRHFDCTGKSCPSYFVNQSAWNGFKDRLTNTVPTPTTNGLDYSLVFDANYYVNNYPDLRKAIGTDATKLLSHFITNGMAESRRAIATFDVKVYKDNNKDLRDEFIKHGDDWELYYKHYITNGHNENRIHV